MKKIFSLFLIFFALSTNSLNSKGLPPGSPDNVPANILIMLDRTYSMTKPAGTFGKTFAMRAPFAAVYDPVGGNYWAAEEFTGGISRWNQDQDPTINEKLNYTLFSSTKILGNDCPTSARENKHITDPIQIETWNGLIFTAHSKAQIPDKGKVKTFDPLIAEKKAEQLRADNANDTANPHIIKCSKRIADFEMQSSHIAIDIQDNILYAMGGGKSDLTTGGYIHGKHYLFIRDLSKTGTGSIKYGNWVDHNTRSCTDNRYRFASGRTDGNIPNGKKLRVASQLLTAIAVDKDHKYLYVTNESGRIFSFVLAKNGSEVCINVNQTINAMFPNPCGVSHGLVTDPDNANILYSTGYYTNQICRMELSNGNIVSGTTLTAGIGDAYSPQSDGNLYLMQPRSIKFDRDIGGKKNLIVANPGRLEIVIVNRDLEFKKAFGMEGVSRMRGAIESIKAVVTDTTLTAGASFGLALWSKGDNSKYTGWNYSKDHSRWCDEQNCMPVKVSTDGAAKIFEYLKKPPSLYDQTHATAFSRMARDYYNHNDSPQDASISCQSNYIIVIGDGAWADSTHAEAKSTISTLANRDVKTIMIAYGDGIPSSAMYKFNQIAAVGGSNYTTAFAALNAQDLKTQLRGIIASITSENLAYTAPAISGSINDNEKVYQMQFDYYASKEWEGSLKQSVISGIQVDTNYEWEASEQMPTPSSRNIWTSLEGLPNNTNNFIDTNSDKINQDLFTMTGNQVPDYHNDSGSAIGNGRCGRQGANIATVEDGDADDAAGLINFIRGQDYFDYDADCDLSETRDHYLADIYNSQVLVVGDPNADFAYLNENQESYFREQNNYKQFQSDKSGRDKVIYAGANNGILHAFDASNGKEIWGFVPPLIAGKLPTMVNPGLNKRSSGGTVPIFGVDGSPVVHDVFMKMPTSAGQSKEWNSILMVPYGRGGAGFSVLNVTDPNSPSHLYSILNDRARGIVYRSDHDGKISAYNYSGASYNINDLSQVKTVTNNYRNNTSIPNNCNALGTTSCFRGNIITVPNVNNYNSNSDVKIYVDGEDITAASLYSKLPNSNTIKITLPSVISYSADPNSTVINSTVNVSLSNPMSGTGIDYDYRFLGETWSSPRIFRLPNDGAGDANEDDDIYVAVFGGGNGAGIPGVGSNLFVVNLENGKILKRIDIPDFAGNNIANSVPTTPIVITADQVLNADFRGALVYINDLEGKITKINLTNMRDDRALTGSPQLISMYDTNIIFSAESTKENGRYMYHSMEAAIGSETNNLWLFTGTGNYKNLTDVGIANKYKIDNIMLGIKDEYFPNYKNKPFLTANNATITTTTIDDLDQCENTSGDTTGANCPDNAKRGWYSLLDSQEGQPGNVQRKQRKVSGEPTISAGQVYFPIFKPSPGDPCAEGVAFICTLDDECGTNNISLIGSNSTTYTNERCLHVGMGVLSKPIIHNRIIYNAIAGESIVGNQDLVILPSAEVDPTTYRINWREN